MTELRMGTCSWRYDSWQGLVYSAAKGIDYLKEYASQFNTVEIDRWFWSLFNEENVVLPNPSDAQVYRQSVPDDFRFTIKVPNSITLTHFYQKNKDEPLQPNPYFLSVELFQRFLTTIAPLRDVLGPLMFQFEYLNLHKMESQARFHTLLGAFVKQLPTGYQYGLEVRNPPYLNRSLFEFLNGSGLVPVFLQGYYMPPVTEIFDRYRSLVLKQKTVVIRLHGPDRQGMEERTGKRWDKVVEARDAELAGIAVMVRHLLSQGITVYVNTNNHYEGSAPLTIDRLRHLL